jgi:broad specificity phosphatase PhoE
MTRDAYSAPASGGWSVPTKGAMPTLYLIRHGENDFTGKRLVGRRPGVHLNDRGREQAALVADSLKTIKFRKIYSSPLERAVETAEPLARSLKKKIVFLDLLAEVDFGVWTGQSLSALRKLPEWEDLMTDPDWGFPGGESLPSVRERVRQMLSTVTAEAGKNDRIALFTHGDIIRLALEMLLEMPVGGFHKFHVSTASLTVAALGLDKPRLQGFNLQPPYVLP